MNQRTKLATAAVLTVKDAPAMTKAGRRTIANWLRKQAAFIEANAKELAPTFRARYLYKPRSN